MLGTIRPSVSKMETFYYDVREEGACELFDDILFKNESKVPPVGKIIGCLFFVMVVVGLTAFTYRVIKKKKEKKKKNESVRKDDTSRGGISTLD